MAQTALIAALLAGLLGGLHCVAMCGGWLAASAARPAAVVLSPRRTLVVRQALAHFARILTYATLGAVLGAAGGATIAATLEPLQRSLYVVANIALIAIGVSMVRGVPSAQRWIERIGLGVFRRVAPAARRLARRGSWFEPLAMGALWGLTPCALVYGLLPVALLSGSAASGAAILAVFGLGTLPNLVFAQAVMARTRGVASRGGWRLAAAAIVVTFGAIGIYRAIFVPEALGASAYCVVSLDPHGKLAAFPP
jgi:sulfite exporter TauE/SafE